MHLCTCVNEEGVDGEAARSETPSLLSYTLRYVSFAEVVSVCRVALREPMCLCTSVSEEVGDREGAGRVGTHQMRIEKAIFNVLHPSALAFFYFSPLLTRSRAAEME
jgi:hypothetical protein